MLPAAHRLTRSADFERTVRGGARAGGPNLVIHLLADESGDDRPKVGFVVSKAVGNAVHRNRVKRRLRAAAAGRLGELPRGARVVVRALPPAADCTYATLRDDVQSGLLRAERRRAGRRPVEGRA